MGKVSYNNKWFELKPQEKKRIVEILTKTRIKITETKGFEHSQVCACGIPLSEINPISLESTIVKNLFIAGELLDIDGDCGGYNLMTSFLTGTLAGKGASEEVD